MAAIGEIVRRDEFFPTVARIRNLAVEIARREHALLLMAPTPTEAAWAEYATAMNGGYRNDPLPPLSAETRAIVAYLGGWEHLAEQGCAWSCWIAAANAVRVDVDERRAVLA